MSDSDDQEYEVGYQKPPKHTRFKKGHSGNPKGRPKGARGLKTDLRAELSERVAITENGRRKTLTKQQLVMKQLTARAVKGDIRAISKLAELAIALLGPEDEASQAEDKLSEEDEAILQSFLERNAGEQGNEQ
ncbi:DUF5681 domain-containing protein [Ruegeria sp. 2205SS24-7]|uniref:DUF5681 domain-containing protein n=1 Tax=Ruegeria discodermiae TaxID=3064389 RepID=UPI0027406B1A|nr:DUF5681 domain-containing protein [Ruegeria sp. 2205SS24-7]MDP5220405.1 DUF5681 domain-containing protein [Ruegeria sp. 2205SS24-7]